VIFCYDLVFKHPWVLTFRNVEKFCGAANAGFLPLATRSPTIALMRPRASLSSFSFSLSPPPPFPPTLTPSLPPCLPATLSSSLPSSLLPSLLHSPPPPPFPLSPAFLSLPLFRPFSSPPPSLCLSHKLHLLIFSLALSLLWLRTRYYKAVQGGFKDKLYECTIEPGEVLYFPDHWWHATLNIGDTVCLRVLCVSHSRSRVRARDISLSRVRARVPNPPPRFVPSSQSLAHMHTSV
jgi:hypothetical protein